MWSLRGDKTELPGRHRLIAAAVAAADEALRNGADPSVDDIDGRRAKVAGYFRRIDDYLARLSEPPEVEAVPGEAEVPDRPAEARGETRDDLENLEIAGRLPPRTRQVLDRLLAGDSEKQAAQAMGISRHTVHDHVKVLHREFDVASRGELLARFVSRSPSGG